MWLINFFLHPSFCIPLQMGFMLSSGTKSVLLAQTAIQWQKLSVCVQDFDPFRVSFFAIHYTIFLSLLVLTFSGWGTFRELLTVCEICQPVISAGLLMIGVTILLNASNLTQIAAGAIVSIAGFFAVFQCAVSVIFLFQRVVNSFWELGLEIPDSVRIVGRFGIGFLVSAAGILGLFFPIARLEIAPALAWGVAEAGMLSLACGQVWVFMIRDAHAGAAVVGQPSKNEVRALTDPGGSEVVVFSTRDA
jgi:hypothetical protein